MQHQYAKTTPPFFVVALVVILLLLFVVLGSVFVVVWLVLCVYVYVCTCVFVCICTVCVCVKYHLAMTRHALKHGLIQPPFQCAPHRQHRHCTCLYFYPHLLSCRG